MTAEEDRTETPARRGLGLRMLLALVLLAFLAGLGTMAWFAARWTVRDAGQGALSDANVTNGGETLANATPDETDNAAPSPQVPGAAGSDALDLQAARIAELDQRLTRIALGAQAAAYNANRAEALLTAFAVRRAVDAGHSLGYLEGTLRLRFGEAQPKAVATIINAAAEPVTLGDLRLALEAINPSPSPTANKSGWWPNLWREVSGIAVVRRADAPSAAPAQRLARARAALQTGHVDAAIKEVAALPQQAPAQRWLESARRYNEAHRALDLIEAAAILEPRVGSTPAPSLAAQPAASAPGNARPR